MMYRLVPLLFIVCCSAYCSVASADSRPNIVIIMADDLGYGDVSCYGATKIHTPNIDALAAEGMMFTDAHAAASVCSPSRYGLMTGRSPWRLHRKGNGYKLEPGRMTLASLASEHGYQSAAVGKWHLGYGRNWEAPLSPGPLEAGFNYHFGVPTNHNDKYRAFVRNHDFVGLKPGAKLKVVKGQQFPSGLLEPRVEDQVDTRLTSEAIGFIRRNAEQPFFLYFTPCAPHTHVTPAAPFRGTSQAGMLGDYIQELDHHVGEIVDVLDELKIADNTLLIFTSDNGNSPKDFKGTQNTILNLQVDSHDIREKFKTAKEDARKMGHYTNGPWQDGKGKPYEGGHRIPFIARWPGQVTPDSMSNQLVILTDIMATMAEIWDAKLPDNAGEDSFSILPAMTGAEPKGPVREIGFVQGDTKDDAIAIRADKWKLIESKGENGKKHELFDLTEDRGENNNLASQNPEVIERISAALAKARADGRTRPLP
ncbi:sulfatase family protein [Rhodopirellula sallentina]|uniref:Arylsulfatase A n=1 Tax=Rhodopirellula sallentina SM41 TaxID=1263870 RepID=M5U4T9_9BACT|nr:arylsulfatase [Rhodopirellula sallentina]EMI52871.1 arylsulfatase A [Rhodopirellula sallentina SM41]